MNKTLVCWFNLRILFLKHTHLFMIGTQRILDNTHTDCSVSKLFPMKLQTKSLILYEKIMQTFYMRTSIGCRKINIHTVNRSLCHHLENP